MAYDPKKKRPSTKSLDSVVDEIFGEEKPSEAKKAKPVTKKSSRTKSTAKPSSAKTEVSDKKASSSSASKTSENKSSSKAEKPKQIAKNVAREPEIPDNVVPLKPRNEEVPLITQPQIWIATAIAAILMLIFIKKRK